MLRVYYPQRCCSRLDLDGFRSEPALIYSPADYEGPIQFCHNILPVQCGECHGSLALDVLARTWRNSAVRALANAEQRAEIAQLVETGPDRAVHGVVR
jgi:hypothetical protein